MYIHIHLHIHLHIYIENIYIKNKYIYIFNLSIWYYAGLYWPVLGQIQFCSFDRICKTCLDTKPVCNLPHPNRLCACSKTGFVPTLNQPLQNRLCDCSKTGFVPTLNQPLQNRLCACSQTSLLPSLNLLHQSRLCAYAQPAAPKTCLFILNEYFDCLRGKVWLSGFGFSSPYRGFNLSIWY